MLDSNIYDLLVEDAEALARVQQLVDAGELQILCPATVRHELENSPFGGVPTGVPVKQVMDAVAVYDHSRYDEARYGDGTAYKRHKGESRKVADAVIAECAFTDAEVLVTEDKRAGKRIKEIGYECSSMNYGEFRERVLKLDCE
ncbi:MAG: hypothetical protein ABIP48_09140 [Planctomycetota bacterium]